MRMREFLAEWLLTGAVVLSAAIMVGGASIFLYGAWIWQHPTKPDPVYYNKGPQDPVETH